VNPLVPILVIAAVAALALAMRAFGSKSSAPDATGAGASSTPAPSWDSDDDDDDEMDEEADEDGMVEAAAITSDGWAFVPRGQSLELVPPGEDEELLKDQAERHGAEALKQAMAAAPVNPHTGRRLVYWKPGETLDVGDMIAARIVRGAPDFDPWRLEALGRDYDYRSFAFETQEAANIALGLVSERIVRPPRDAHGDAIPVGAEDFAVARRKYDETAEAVAMESDEELEP
jgi:hypothetical protein